MDLFVKDLPPDTQILIAMGSAIAAGCRPCLERLVALAETEDIECAQMRAAVTIGQFVKDQPRKHMQELAAKLLGTQFADDGSAGGCNCPSECAPSQQAGA